ncbi:MAG: sulfur relay protein TusB/DsrH, partial [Lysobacterales bacterium]
SLADCLAFFNDGDEILLIDAGVELLADEVALRSLLEQKSTANQVCAICEDVVARNLTLQAQENNIDLIRDSEWVEHVLCYSHILSWK